MLKKISIVALLVSIGLVAQAQQDIQQISLGDWPELRGPHRDGTSSETELPDSWSLEGDQFLWRAPFGGRSTPVVVGNRVYVQNPAGRGPNLQERVMALNANTGDVVWEYRFNVFQSDVPPHRISWASPAVDTATDNIYALGGGALLVALDKNGALLWKRSIGEEFAAFTTHGGRTASPLIDGNLVIVSAAVSNWGEHGMRRIRYIALDKHTGHIVYVAQPGGRPYDTSYSPMTIRTINGMRLLISGLGNGGVHAIKPQTGETVWSFPAAKRAVNTGVVIKGNTVFMSHGDENFDTVDMGLIAAFDGSESGTISTRKWSTTGVKFRTSSPVLDGDRLYQIDGGGTLHSFDTETGQEYWTQRLGNAQQAPLVMGDGKLYAGTNGGSFFIIRPHPDRAEVLSQVTLPDSTNSCCGSEGTPEQIVSGAAISNGRVFFVSSDAVYAIGPKVAKTAKGLAVDDEVSPGEGPPTYLQVIPTELTLLPGEQVELRAKLFDKNGRFLHESTPVWTLEGLKGTVTNQTFTAGTDAIGQAGLIKATAEGLTGSARARISRPLSWTETFENYEEGETPPGWANMGAGQFAVTTLDGEKVLHKKPVSTLFKRIRVFTGPFNASNYTMKADIRAPTRRRQMADVGIVAQTYTLALYGTTQQLKIEPWEPETERTVKQPYAWEADTWHRVKLRVQTQSDGQVLAQGKAWAVGQAEPPEWMLERLDPVGSHEGSPGFFIDAEFGAYIDNVQVTTN